METPRAEMKKACVLGSGAFGTALAQLMARQGVLTTAWTRSQDVTDLITRFVDPSSIIFVSPASSILRATLLHATAAGSLGALAANVLPGWRPASRPGRTKPCNIGTPESARQPWHPKALESSHYAVCSPALPVTWFTGGFV